MFELQSGRRGIHGEHLNGHIVDCVRRHEITFQPCDLSLSGSFCPASSTGVFMLASVLLESVFPDKTL